MDTTCDWFNYLHNTRKLSESIINEAGLSVAINRLKIPVFDEAGNEVFAKYRRAPWSEEGPKYTYEVGGRARLYGTSLTDMGGDNFFCEGEFDALALRTLGYNAFTSTGGALTFRIEWLDDVPARNNVIFFDNDDTGIKGAVKLAKLLQFGTYKWVPPAFGKDASDLLAGVDFYRAKEIIDITGVPFDLRATNQAEKKVVIQKLTNYALAMDQCVGKQFLLQLIFDLKQDIKPPAIKKHHRNFDNAVEDAKAYPMENLIKFSQRKAICPFHVEKTGSLHLYPDNHAFCHGSCNRAYDSIDVYRKLYGGTFQEAIAALNNKA
jgi:Toprim-like/CHC2 zinc finger